MNCLKNLLCFYFAVNVKRIVVFCALFIVLFPAFATASKVAVFVYSGAKSESVLAACRAISASGHTVHGISTDDIKQGRLTVSNFDVLLLPPGQDGLQTFYADETYGLGGLDVVTAIRVFVSGGGGFIGIEAGAHFASASGPLALYNGEYVPWDNTEGGYTYTIEDPPFGSGEQDIFLSATGGYFPTPYPDGSTTILKNGLLSRSALRCPYGAGQVVLLAPNPTLRGDSDLDWTMWDNWVMGGTHENSVGAWELFGRMINFLDNGTTGVHIQSVNPDGKRVAVVSSYIWATSVSEYAGAHPSLLPAVGRMVQDSGHIPLAIRFNDIHSDRLIAANFDAVVFPGGNAAGYTDSTDGLGGAESKILDFVSNGGRYLGICAGSFYASSSINWQGTDYDYPLDLFSGVDTGPFNDLSSAPDTVADAYKWYYWDTTPIVVNDTVLGSMTQQQFYLGGGAKSAAAGVTPVAFFGDSSSTSYNKTDAIRFSHGSGRVLLTGAHPEVRSGTDEFGMDKDWLFWDNYYPGSTNPLNNPDNPWLFVNAIFNKWFFPQPDAYEENDSRAEAHDLSAAEKTWLSEIAGKGTQADYDWYKIVANSGENRILADLRFTHADGDMDLDLYDADGTLLEYSDSIDDNEYIDYSLTEGGTYYLLVYDYFSTAGEGNEYDLWWDDVAPDLVVINPGVSDSSLTPGQSFTINATAKNQGSFSSAGTTLHYYRSPDSTITTSDSELATDTVPGLAVGATSPQSGSATGPDTAGTYYVGACIDTVSDESNIANQCSAGVQITVTLEEPDLVVINPAVSDSSLSPGQSFTISVTAKNQGSSSSAGTTLRYYRSTDSTITTSDSQLATDAVTGLAVGATSAESSPATAPTAGTYYVGACIDTVSNEVNVSNQCSTGVRITVKTVVVSTEPDLVVISPGVSAGSVSPGASFTISATAKNQGGVTANSTLLRYYLSSSATLGGGAIPLATDLVASLAAGATSPENAAVYAPSAQGTYWIISCVDPVMKESNISNQCSSAVQISVAAAPVVTTPPVVTAPSGINIVPVLYLLLTQ